MEKTYKYNPKKEFEERIKKILPDEKDMEEFWKFCHTEPINSIRCNTLKISPEKLKEKISKYCWKLKQPFKEYPEIFIIEKETDLKPGEIGKTIEHILGYYYVQDISSMMPPIALSPQKDDIILDLCASPGSKTTQMAAMMKNKGTIIANDLTVNRTMILNANLEKCGVTNTIVTRKDAVRFCQIWNKKIKKKFDKILLDVPCSGEGTLRKSPHTMEIWNLNFIKSLSQQQKKICSAAIPLLKKDGVLVYSTCTLSIEENEEVVDFMLKNFNLEIEDFFLPIKTREGISNWEGKKFNEKIKFCKRIYPHDNDSDGFFLAKMRKK